MLFAVIHFPPFGISNLGKNGKFDEIPQNWCSPKLLTLTLQKHPEQEDLLSLIIMLVPEEPIFASKPEVTFVGMIFHAS